MVFVRAVHLNDLDSLATLFDAYRVFYNMPSDLRGAENFLKDRILNKESEVFVAVEDSTDKLVGFVQLYPLFSSTRMKRLWLLNDLFVASAYRGHGVAYGLLEAVQRFATETNACGLMLETARTNETANRLYKRAGFVADQEHNYYTWDV